MTQTQELIERLEKLIVDEVLDGDMRSTVRAAAARLSQLEGEVGRLREALRLIANRPTRIPIDPHGLAQFARAALERHDKGEKL